MTINYIILTLSGFFSTFIAVIGLLLKRIDKNLNIIGYAMMFTFAEDIFSRILIFKYHNNSWMYYVTAPIEYVLFSLFLVENTCNTWVKKFTFLSYASIGSYLIVNLILYKVPYPATLYLYTSLSFLLSICAISYYRDLLINNVGYFRLNVPVLIINTGILFCYSSTAIYFALLIYMGDTPAKYLNPNIVSKIKELKPLIDLVTIALYLCIAAGLLISMFKKKEMAK